MTTMQQRSKQDERRLEAEQIHVPWTGQMKKTRSSKEELGRQSSKEKEEKKAMHQEV